MRLTPEQVAEVKKYLSEFKEMLWFGEHVLTSAEQDLFDTIEALQQENEQLRAQVARMRGMLFELNEIAKDYAPWGNRYNGKGIGDIIQNADKLLDANTVQAYHNPADVVALRKAREVLYNLRMDDYPGFSAICEALAAIDKVIGGKEDGV